MSTAGLARFGTGAAQDGWSGWLDRPLRIELARRIDDVAAVVAWAEAEALQGRWAVLLLPYEAAPAFDTALSVRPSAGALPLAWAASYAAMRPVTTTAGVPGTRAAGHTLAWRPGIDKLRFDRDLDRILAHITAGDTYQVNYTFPLTAPFAASPWDWFEAAAAQARVPYAAYIDTGDAVVMSLSPELFVERRGTRLRTRPMKGTVRRGRWLAEDHQLSRALVESDKARAENVMIVDLLRNDLGRVAVTGSVVVRDLCRLERYPTVWQLTSTVDATTPEGTSLLDVLRATFPCGSVTGAPKVRTMEIIAGLEAAPRGIYTGAICLLRPGGDFVSSVPIRTAVLERAKAAATFSVGAGITADSVADDEWAECLAKSRVVRPPAVPDDAELFETLRLEHGVPCRRAAHTRRLLDSATLFGWPVDASEVDKAVEAAAARHGRGVWRMRVFLAHDGRVRVEAVPFEPTTHTWRVVVAPGPIDPRSPLIFNKTTRRDVYDAARRDVPGVDDVLLWNPRRELTESTVGNVVVELDGVRVTPPVDCGLLPGVFRQELLDRGEVEERIVPLAALRSHPRLWIVNSLRGWIEVALTLPAGQGPAATYAGGGPET